MAEDNDEDDLQAALALSMQQGAAAAPAAAPAAAAGPPATAAEQAAEQLKAGSSAGELTAAGSVQVLSALLGNLVKSPAEEKFRKVKRGNAKIAKALSRPGAEALLLAAGFNKGEETFEIPADAAGDAVKQAAQDALDALGSACGAFALAAQLRAEGPVRCVCALPSTPAAPSGQIAFGAMDNLVRLYKQGAWDAAPQLLFGHERRAGVDGVLAVVADGGDGGLCSAGRDGKIVLWDAAGNQRATLSGHGEGVQGTNVHVVACLGRRRSDGALLSGGWDKTARAWVDDKQVERWEGHSVAVNSVVGLPNGDVASGSGDQSVFIWRGATKVHTLTAGSPVRALCSCGGSLLASASNDGVVRLWDASSGSKVAETKVSEAYLLSLAFQGGLLAAGGDDGSVTLLELEGKSLSVGQLLQHCGEAYGLAFLDNRDLAVACGDSSCVVWSRSSQRAAPGPVQQDYTARIQAYAAARGAAAAPAGGAAPGGGGGGGGSWEFSYPVELGGRKMTLQWNRGEEAQTVATRFIDANGLDQAQHMGDVVSFVLHAQQKAAMGGGAAQATGGGGAGSFDFSYPVEVADGRRLTISWNRGDNPQEVAMNFARQHGGIAGNELPDIENFISQVSGGPAAPMAMQVEAAPSPAAQQQAVQQVQEIACVAEAQARAALEAANWNVEGAIQRLLS
eukprot:TRINITY_DN24621_c0_g1_i1.p2 TRINITY_DN24621_c0_g1~~TRINITY_DN24621_c0_g1_i1.p2  ORF type:complete len:679 (+),score=221.32 TRINITY_DN24621_c0_g1_i1:62-2098(+)